MREMAPPDQVHILLWDFLPKLSFQHFVPSLKKSVTNFQVENDSWNSPRDKSNGIVRFFD